MTEGANYSFEVIAFNIKGAESKAGKSDGIVIDITKRQAQILNKTSGTPQQPDGVEVYNAATGWFMDVDVNQFFEFIESIRK